MLGGGIVKELYELKGEGLSIRGIARELGISRNSVRKYLRSPEPPKHRPRRRRYTATVGNFCTNDSWNE